MSKTSKPRDLANHVSQGIWAHRRQGWCPGCGLHPWQHGEHRADCTTTHTPDCPVCLYHPNVHGRHRADCPHREKEPA